MSTARPQRVLFVGLGAMGEPMASRLANAGHRLSTYDIDPVRNRKVATALGVQSVASERLHAVAADVDTVLLMLPDSTAVEDVLIGPEGVLSALTPGTTVLDMGSSRPASTVALAEWARARDVAVVDAPVSGGVARATTGKLAIMVGGDPAHVVRVSGLLDALGSASHIGPPGAGHAMKSLNNLLSAIGLTAASEVLTIGANFGLEPSAMLDVLNGSTGRNHATEVKLARFVLSRSFDSGFALRLMVKDLQTALDLAHQTATPAPLAAGCLEQWMAAARDQGPDADHTRIAAYVEARAKARLVS